MASWNELCEGGEMVECPVCMVKMLKRKKSAHMTKCYENYEELADEMGIMRCPLYPLHIFPKKYLNHHLDGNCEEALNMLRKYFQKHDLKSEIKPAPDNFLAEIPEEVLNKHNKHLLYVLKKDFDGNDIGNDPRFYQTEEDETVT